MPYKSKPSIFVVDDEASVLEAFKALFQNDFKIDVFDSYSKALSALGRRTYSVGIVDIILGAASGETLLTAFKKTWPLTEIVMITAAKDRDLAKRCYEKGAYDFVTKPWENEALKRVVRRAAEKYELARNISVLDQRLAISEKAKKKIPKKFMSLPNAISELEKRTIYQALAASNWNQVHASRRLDIHRNTLVNKMKQYKIATVRRPKGLGLKNKRTSNIER
jgi:DNA-binding NtrC family response regulator